MIPSSPSTVRNADERREPLRPWQTNPTVQRILRNAGYSEEKEEQDTDPLR